MAAPIGNKYAIGNNGGRPPLFATPEALLDECDAYFEYIKGEKGTKQIEVTDEKTGDKKTDTIDYWIRLPEPATVTGLTLYLGFADRGSLDDYEKKDEFSHIIKRARKRVEYAYELKLHEDKNTGAIFALKNMGWSDRVEMDHTTKGQRIGQQQDLSMYTDDELRQLADLQRKGGTGTA